MTAEGTFPKADGDVFYASEANMFYPKVIGQVFQEVQQAGSATDYVTAGGSILYPGTGSLAIKSFMEIKHNALCNAGITGGGDFQILMSGAGVNNVGIGSLTAGGSSQNGQCFLDIILTSGLINTYGGNIGSEYTFFTQTKSNANVNREHQILTIIGF